MRSLTRVMLLGHLAADPETRQTKNGHSLAVFPVAVNRVYLGKDGKKNEIVDFHRIVAWSKLGEICEKYLKKGMAVLVEGRLINRSFDDKEGNRHFRTEVYADYLNILTWRKSKGGVSQLAVENVAGEAEEQEHDDVEVAA